MKTLTEYNIYEGLSNDVTTQEWSASEECSTFTKIVIDYAEENNLTSNQEFINFLDTINELSVRY